MDIWTAREIRAEMAGRGYSLLRAAELHISDEMMQDWLSLSIDFASLPQVEHSPGGPADLSPIWAFLLLAGKRRTETLASARLFCERRYQPGGRKQSQSPAAAGYDI